VQNVGVNSHRHALLFHPLLCLLHFLRNNLSARLMSLGTCEHASFWTTDEESLAFAPGRRLLMTSSLDFCQSLHFLHHLEPLGKFMRSSFEIKSTVYSFRTPASLAILSAIPSSLSTILILSSLFSTNSSIPSAALIGVTNTPFSSTLLN